MNSTKNVTWKELFARVGIKGPTVISVDPTMRYVVLCDVSRVPVSAANALTDEFKALGVKAVVFLLEDPDRAIRIMEMKEDL